MDGRTASCALQDLATLDAAALALLATTGC
jgi:hypothetical protein